MQGTAQAPAREEIVVAPSPASEPGPTPFFNPSVRALMRSKVFWTVCVLKLGMGAMLASHYMRDLFVPFVNYFVESHFANPWAHFVALGNTDNFPYPPMMLYVFALPRLLLTWALPHGTEVVTWAHLLVMRLPLLACDSLIAVLLATWFPGRNRRIITYYWCSPLTIYVLYWHGQLDIIPTALFVSALHFIRKQRPMTAMVILGLSLAAKTHLFVALPFVFVYLYERLGPGRTLRAGIVVIGTYLAVLLPYLFSPAFMLSVFFTQEQARLFALRVPIGPQMWLLVAPAAILLLWFRFLTYRQRNWDLLMLYLGMLFSIFMLLAPPAPGYVLWSLPFLLHFLCRARNRDAVPLATYEITYLAFFWLYQGSDLFDAWRTTLPSIAKHLSPYAYLMGTHPAYAAMSESLSFTILQASLAGVILHMYLVGVRRNHAHNARTTPVMIGVAGDSGAGKNTFVRLITDLIGGGRVAVVAGDDYHRWPRGHEMWKSYTHLHMRANDLHRQYRDAVIFSSGQPVLKSEYDHATGQPTPEELTDPGEVMVFQGLHTLSIEALKKMYDLTVFLDPEEPLRRQWKIERDRRERGYTPEQVSKALAERQTDRERFVLPQMQDAELVVRWMRCGQSTKIAPSGLALEIEASNSFNFEEIVSQLKMVETLDVEHEYHSGRKQSMRLNGDISVDQVAAVAHAVIHDHSRLLSDPHFRSDLDGCLQIVFAVCLTEKVFLRQSLFN